MKRFILIDAHAVIHRAYHALPPLSTPLGEPVNAVYGFTTILLRILRELKPDYIAAALDLPGPTFRHVAYERYKAQRPETPSDLSSQFAKVKEVLAAFAIPVFEKEGYEADDLIGTIAKKLEKRKNLEAVIVTGDMDTLQLVKPGLKVYAMKKGITETVIYDEKAVKERYGFRPEQLIDFKGLKGDPSDNIPGVKGIGEKTASELIKNFGSVEGIYKALKKRSAKISAGIADKLRQGEEDAKFSRELARIKIDVPLEFSLVDAERKGDSDTSEVRQLFLKFGFSSLLKRLDAEETRTSGVKKEQARPSFAAQSLGGQAVLLSGIPQRKSSIQILETKKDFQKFKKELGDEKIGLLLHEGNLILVNTEKKVFRIAEKLLWETVIKQFLEKEAEALVYDAKSLFHFLRKFGINLPEIKFDLLLAAYLTQSFSRDFSFPAVAARELGRLVASDSEEEFSLFFAIVKSLESKLNQGKIKFIFEKIEMPLTNILADMEERGILLDRDFLKKMGGEVDKNLAGLTKEIYKLAGEDFNINSSQQLSRVLFEKLKISVRGLRKTEKGGVISTGASELEKLKKEHPIIEQILGYRELTKLKTTYIDALPELVDSRTGRLHTTFNQTGTSTGRLSSSNPNLQNIPIMSEYGREIRKAFVAGKSFELVSFDYSQIELRVAAHLADDQKMIEAFNRGLDIHKMTAAEIYNIPLEKVTPELRRAAKTLNFGILYGMGSSALAESTGMSREEAKKFIEEYFRDFAGVKNYLESTKKFVEENGYVETLFGRRRYIPEIYSSNWQLKREAERMAINMPIQGTATGDIVKMAMTKIDEWIKKERLEKEVRMLLQVHDELLFEIKEDLIKKVAPKIKEVIEGVTELKVPLVAEVKAGPNWGEQKEI